MARAVGEERQLESHLLVLVTLGLVAFGLVMVYSATSAPAALATREPDVVPQAAGRLRALGVALMIVCVAHATTGVCACSRRARR